MPEIPNFKRILDEEVSLYENDPEIKINKILEKIQRLKTIEYFHAEHFELRVDIADELDKLCKELTKHKDFALIIELARRVLKEFEIPGASDLDRKAKS
jgi:hypothetical protein